MSDTQYQLGFIGAGKLAGSVIRGLLQLKFCAPAAIIASEPNAEARAILESDLGIRITTENTEVAEKTELIFIGVKPQAVLPVLRGIGDAVSGKLVVSFAAGIQLDRMEAAATARMMRVMTNTPAAIGRAATGVAAGSRSTVEDMQRLLTIFAAIGTAAEIHEDEIDAVTALAGSGPAFVYSVIESLAAGAIAAGLRSENALQLAAQMTLGAAELALISGKSPEELRRMVVTPGGTTAAGLAAMDRLGANAALTAAVEAAARRGREMSREFGS